MIYFFVILVMGFSITVVSVVSNARNSEVAAMTSPDVVYEVYSLVSGKPSQTAFGGVFILGTGGVTGRSTYNLEYLFYTKRN
jgi:hypothetical protein